MKIIQLYLKISSQGITTDTITEPLGSKIIRPTVSIYQHSLMVSKTILNHIVYKIYKKKYFDYFKLIGMIIYIIYNYYYIDIIL